MWKTVRKFGFDSCDLPTMLWNISVMLRIHALNIDTKHTERIPIVFYVVTALSTICYYYTFFISVAWFVFVRSPQTGELVPAMVVLSLGVCSEIAPLKLGNMYFKAKSIRHILSEYLACDGRVQAGSRFADNLRRTLRTVKRRAVSFWLLINVNALLYVLLQCLMRPENYVLDNLYGLEPKPHPETRNYDIRLSLLVISVISNCFVASNTTVFFIIIAGYSQAQIYSLSEELLNVYNDVVLEYYTSIGITITRPVRVFSESDKKSINKEIKKRLIKLIDLHVTNMDLLRQVEQVFSLPIALGIGCLTIGLIAELLGGLENTYMQVPYTVSQVVMECWSGQNVMDASEAFSRAVYCCKWENFDRSNMKLVLLMLQSSQKTLTLSAGGMTVLNFAFLMSLVRSTYSTYTALRSMI